LKRGHYIILTHTLSAPQPETGSEAGALQLEGERAAALFLPSATANWRLNLLRSGAVPDAEVAKLRLVAIAQNTSLHPAP